MSVCRAALDAERWLIGALLLEGAHVGTVASIVSPEDFAEPGHRHLFEALQRLHAGGAPINFVTVGKELEKAGHLSETGGSLYLVDLAEEVTTTALAGHHAQLVAQQGQRRRAAELLSRASDALEEKPEDQTAEFLEGLAAELRAIAAPGSGRGIDTVCMADVESRPVTWLWPGRIALGKVTLLVGDPGLGKSTLALDLAARVTRALAMPACSQASTAGQVLIVTAEDALEDTIRPRLEAAGADLKRVHAVRAVRVREGERCFCLTEDLRDLERKAGELDELRLLLFDPVSAFMGATDAHKNADVRRVLAPLAALAERHRCAVLAISHLTKTQGPAQDRAQGSVAFVAAARATWYVTKDRQDPERRLLVQGKNNLGDAQALAFRIQTSFGPANTTVPRIEWEPEPVSITADEALAPEDSGEERSELERVSEWLVAELESGPVQSKELFRAAKESDISAKALYRARKRLGARIRKDSTRGPWIWELGRLGEVAQPRDSGKAGQVGQVEPEGPENSGHRNGAEARTADPGRLAEPRLFDGSEEVEQWH